jgi:hypothetical protein
MDHHLIFETTNMRDFKREPIFEVTKFQTSRKEYSDEEDLIEDMHHTN